ncbi:MAG: single-stranded DNA-binding protein [Deltaproteobacteria bacterium]|nr:single-stranded DNA-binding protein [Deltaproteobacteria bacterium]
MASVNKVLLVGNLGKDPEVRFTPTGRAVCTFSLATSEQWKTDTGQQERTEWHNIVVWGKSAEHCGQYLKKGRQVYVEGAIRSRRYDAKDGTTRYITEIVTQRVQFLGVKPASTESPAHADPEGFRSGDGGDSPESPSVTDEEIPF